MEKDLKWIKSKYGEKMMHLCRELFPKLLDKEGLLPSLLQKYFFCHKNLADDILNQGLSDDFKTFIFSKVDVEKNTEYKTELSATELMKKAGYILYPECQTEADIQSFRHYYERKTGTTPVYRDGLPELYNGEELCTFNGQRLNVCRVWFAVKENVDEILRRDFKNPTRQDEYGTSVISIQFTKTQNSSLSIKNRYNHSVNNPDSTFNNNLDNIIMGLSYAFEKDFGVRDRVCSSDDFELDGYVKAKDGKFYPYNYEINNIYYCPNNVIIDNFAPRQLPTDHQILADYFIVDLKEKTVSLYDKNLKESFIKVSNAPQKISIEKNGVIKIEKQNGGQTIIQVNRKNRIIAFEDNEIKDCGKGFLYFNRYLKKLSMDALQECDDDFLYNNTLLEELNVPNLKNCGDEFMYRNESLIDLDVPNLQICGSGFIHHNSVLCNLNAPRLKECEDSFMYYNDKIFKLDLPELEKCGRSFFNLNQIIFRVNLPKLRVCGDDFLPNNRVMNKISLPALEKCGNKFLKFNTSIYDVDLPNLEKCGDAFLNNNEALISMILPKLQKCGDYFVRQNKRLGRLFLPELIECKDEFLFFNHDLHIVHLPKLQKCGDSFMACNTTLKDLDLPQLLQCGDYFLSGNVFLSELNMPRIKKSGEFFLEKNRYLMEFNFPELKEYKLGFLAKNLFAKDFLKNPNNINSESGVGL